MPRRRPEDVIQRAVFQHIRITRRCRLGRGAGTNGGFIKPVEAKIMQGLGVAAGVPDVLLWHDGKSFALELKAATGRVSASQAMLDRLATAGVATAVYTT